jgi:hypothetical protein
MNVTVDFGAAILEQAANPAEISRNGILIFRRNRIGHCHQRVTDPFSVLMEYEYGEHIAKDHSGDDQDNAADDE